MVPSSWPNEAKVHQANDRAQLTGWWKDSPKRKGQVSGPDDRQPR